MRIRYLREEDILNTKDNTNLPDTSIDNSTEETSSDDISQVGNGIDNKELERRLPSPDRGNYNYRIVPYYIPVGTRNIYRYRDNYLDYDRVIVRDIIDKDFRFTDGSYGIFCEYEGITIKAGGSRLRSRKNTIIVDIDGEIFTKKIKDSDRARKLAEKLINILYNEGEERLLMLLIKYKFN